MLLLNKTFFGFLTHMKTRLCVPAYLCVYVLCLCVDCVETKLPHESTQQHSDSTLSHESNYIEPGIAREYPYPKQYSDSTTHSSNPSKFSYTDDMKPLAFLVIRLFDWARVTLDHIKNPMNIPIYVPSDNRQFITDIYNEKGASDCFVNHILKSTCIEQARRTILKVSKKIDKMNFRFLSAFQKANYGSMTVDIAKYNDILNLMDSYIAGIEQACYSLSAYNANYKSMTDLINDLKRRFSNSIKSGIKDYIKKALSDINVILLKGEPEPNLERLVSIDPYNDRFYLISRHDLESNLHQVAYKIVTDVSSLSSWNNNIPEFRYPFLRLYIVIELLKHAVYY
ncbi:hypothetical protein CWI40_091870 [Ordospora colligata]|nr:hypothetical protein CWI40_091870 [Ordospora colligata]